MKNNTLSLSHQFKMEVLSRFVEENPDKALDLVLKYYQECCQLCQENKVLEQSLLKYRNGLFM